MKYSVHTAMRRIGAAVSEVMALCDALDDAPLWVKDTAGRYQWVNRSFLQNFGFDNRDEVLGRTDFDLCDRQLAETYRADDQRVLKGERITGCIELVGRFDHTSRWCSTTKVPLHDARGRIVGTAGITRPLVGADHFTTGEPLAPAIRLISENTGGKPLANAELARVCGLSVRAFERQFQARYHCTPQYYLRNLRVRQSCHDLAFSHKTLSEIAMELGFTDQSHFNREFRHFIGKTPGNYRKLHRS